MPQIITLIEIIVEFMCSDCLVSESYSFVVIDYIGMKYTLWAVWKESIVIAARLALMFDDRFYYAACGTL